MAEALSKEDNSDFTDMPVGEILRRTRQHYGRSPEDVESDIRIRAHLVVAIEENDIEKLPARVYAIGFVRSYADYLGLDGEKMVALFKSQAGAAASEPEVYIPTEEKDGHAAPKWIVFFTVMISIVAGGLWAKDWTQQRLAVENIPPVPDAMMQSSLDNEAQDSASVKSAPAQISGQPESQQVAEISENTVGPATQTAQQSLEGQQQPEPQAAPQNQPQQQTASAPPAQQQEKGIILNITENSWVEVRQRGGARLISRVLKAGDQYFVPDRPDLVMSVGNAAGVQLQVNGQVLKPLGNPAQVLRNIPLDSAVLQRKYAP